MPKSEEEKRAKKAQKFITKSKKEFEKIIPRDKVDEIIVTSCVEAEGAFEIAGSVATISPTGKQKTFGYNAVVNEDEAGTCSLGKLQVNEL